MVSITDEYMSVSQLLGADALAAPQSLHLCKPVPSATKLLQHSKPYNRLHLRKTFSTIYFQSKEI